MITPVAAPDQVPSVVRAVVHACGTETTYLRAGSGTVMVLVASDLDRDDVRETLTSLAREFLVLAAAPALGDPANLAGWFQEFLECLGIADAHLVLHASASTLLTGDSYHA